MANANAVFANDTSITLDWADVTTANLYHLQVASVPDFSGSMISEDSALAGSTKTFTDAGTNDAKRYWRWRYSTDAGTTWSRWSEVGSYWLDTGGSADVVLSASNWILFDPDNISDQYTLEDFPNHTIQKRGIYRVQDRNRLGTLLSEYVTAKDSITFSFSRDSYMRHLQMREFERFHLEIKTFFLACYKTNRTDSVPNIWLVEFESDPESAMLAAGRGDYFTGEATFTEV